MFPVPRACGAGLVCSAGACTVPVFTTLGANTQAVAVSGDGSVVIGVSLLGLSSPFRWTRSSGIAALTLPQGASQCIVQGVSADGTTAVGYCDNFPTRWSGTSPLILSLALGTTGGTAVAASADGSIFTGGLTSANGTSHTGLWTSGATTTLLPEPAGAGSSGAGISSDGSVIVGNLFLSSDTTGLGQAYRWTRASGVMGLVPFVPGTPAFSHAVGVSADGNKVLIFSKGFATAVWTASTNALTLLPTTFTPRAISGDGNTVVGNDPNVPAIWTGGTSTNLTTRLTSLGVTLGDFVLNNVAGVSTNGKILVGGGSSSSTGVQQGWVVVLP